MPTSTRDIPRQFILDSSAVDECRGVDAVAAAESRKRTMLKAQLTWSL